MQGRSKSKHVVNPRWLRGLALLALALAVVALDGCRQTQGRRYQRRTAARPAAAEGAPGETTAAAPTEESGEPAAAPEGEPAAPAEPAPAEPAPTEPVTAPEEPAAEPEEAPAVSEPAPRPRPDGPSRASEPSNRAQRILELLDAEGKAKTKEVAEYLRDAENHRLNFEFLKAEADLESALKIDPTNAEAQRMLAQVRTELGDYRGERDSIIHDLTQGQLAAIAEAKAEVNMALNRGSRFEDEEEYERAMGEYSKAIEIVRHFPFNLDDAGRLLDEAKTRLTRARERNEAKKLDDQRRFQQDVAAIKTAERQQSLLYERNRIEELRVKSREALAREDFETAMRNAQTILEAYPEDLEARRIARQARERQHVKTQQKIFVDTVENHRLALLSIKESSVIYQQIFRYPPRKEWERISAKAPASVAERFAEAETAVEKEIKQKLQEPQDIGFPDPVAFAEAISLIRQLSGVNIILNKQAQEAAASVEVTLARVRELPLENVLRLILAKVTDTPLDYMIRDGAVIIGTRESLKSKEILHFYDVHDIIQSHPDFPAPEVALEDVPEQGTGGGSFFDQGADAAERGSGAIEHEKLRELVEKEITEDGQVVGSVSFQQGKLAVRSTLQYHAKVQKLLEEFRKATGMMVTVESRFLVLQDNFLEEIGVDIGSGSNTFLLNTIPDIDGAGTSISPGYEFLNAQQDMNFRAASIGAFSNPLGSNVNPFNMTSEGGGAYQLNVLTESYQLEALLTAVSKTQEIRRLSSPRVTAFNTQIAHTMVIEQAAYIKDLEVNQTGIIPVINPVIGVLNTGSILEVRPNVSYDRKYIVLEIQPTLAEQLDSEVALLNLSGNFTQVPVELPVTSLTKLKTTITIPDGGTVLLGGLKREIQNESSIGIPGLRRVPILNLLFGRRGESILRANLFVLINAKITIVQEEEERLFNI
jgi:tetratricopeptide (TPR) repeat protein